MAATDIYLDLEQLKNDIIDQNNKKLPEINRAMNAACNAVASLTAYGWKGEAKDAFMDQFTEYKMVMRVFCENMKEFNNQLKTIQTNGKKLISSGNRIASKL